MRWLCLFIHFFLVAFIESGVERQNHNHNVFLGEANDNITWPKNIASCDDIVDGGGTGRLLVCYLQHSQAISLNIILL